MEYSNNGTAGKRKRKRISDDEKENKKPYFSPTKDNILSQLGKLIKKRYGTLEDRERFGSYSLNPDKIYLYLVKLGDDICKVGRTGDLYSRLKQLSKEYSKELETTLNNEVEVVSIFEMKTGDEETVIHSVLRKEFTKSIITSFNNKNKREIYSSAFNGNKILNRAKQLALYLNLVELRRQN